MTPRAKQLKIFRERNGTGAFRVLYYDGPLAGTEDGFPVAQEVIKTRFGMYQLSFVSSDGVGVFHYVNP